MYRPRLRAGCLINLPCFRSIRTTCWPTSFVKTCFFTQQSICPQTRLTPIFEEDLPLWPLPLRPGGRRARIPFTPTYDFACQDPHDASRSKPPSTSTRRLVVVVKTLIILKPSELVLLARLYCLENLGLLPRDGLPAVCLAVRVPHMYR